MFDRGRSGEKKDFRKIRENQGTFPLFSQEKYHVSFPSINLAYFTTPNFTDRTLLEFQCAIALFYL